MAYLLVHQQDAVGLVLFDDHVRADLAPQSHYPHLQTILHSLEEARLERPTGGKALFSELAGRLKRRSIVMVISDLRAPIGELRARLQTLRHGGHEVIVAQVLDRDEHLRDNHFMSAM